MAMKLKPHHQCFLLIFSISLLSLFLPIINAKLNLHPSDLKALSTLQNQNNLKVKVNPCNTEGVFCERRKLSINETTYVLRITKLVFTSKNLKAKLSPTISLLTELKEVSLSNNKFVDQIPPSIVDCRKLEILNLSNNLFSGEVPSQLSSLVRLRFLDLSSNKLSGNLNFLRYFPNLETLSVADNLFTGRVPNSVRSFRNLRHFNFSGNRFLESSLQYELTDSDASSKRHREGNSCSGLTSCSYHDFGECLLFSYSSGNGRNWKKVHSCFTALDQICTNDNNKETSSWFLPNQSHFSTTSSTIRKLILQ